MHVIRIETPIGYASRMSRRLRHLLPIVALAAAFVAGLALGLQRYLSPETLAHDHATLVALVSDHFWLSLAGFAALYTAALAISLPATLVLCIAGGFLFGPFIGAPVAVVANTLGSTVFCLATRTALGDALRALAGTWIDRLEAGFRDDGFSYVLMLRLSPAPVFIVNLVAAFAGVKARDFALATFLGVIPAATVYALVGDALRSGVEAGLSVDPGRAAAHLMLSWRFLLPIAGLALLALAPLALKRRDRATP